MKKFLASLLIALTLIFSAGPIASAQTVRHRRHRRTFWQKHRNKLTVAGAGLGGAGIGGLAGGRKGALIGAGAGAGAGALYTYKLRHRRHRRRRY
jgi:outer membrane lipoprotein SlyB